MAPKQGRFPPGLACPSAWERSAGKGVSLAVQVVLGVKQTGEKVLLGLMTAGAGSTDGWQLLLDDLAARRMGRARVLTSMCRPVSRPRPSNHGLTLDYQRLTLNSYFSDWSNSRIQSFFFSTSRGFVPSAGPTMPSFSIMSIRRAARP